MLAIPAVELQVPLYLDGRCLFRPRGQMPSPYGIELVERCVECKLRERRVFCNLPPKVMQAIEGIKYTTSYPEAAVLFVEARLPGDSSSYVQDG